MDAVSPKEVLGQQKSNFDGDVVMVGVSSEETGNEKSESELSALILKARYASEEN